MNTVFVKLLIILCIGTSLFPGNTTVIIQDPVQNRSKNVTYAIIFRAAGCAGRVSAFGVVRVCKNEINLHNGARVTYEWKWGQTDKAVEVFTIDKKTGKQTKYPVNERNFPNLKNIDNKTLYFPANFDETLTPREHVKPLEIVIHDDEFKDKKVRYHILFISKSTGTELAEDSGYKKVKLCKNISVGLIPNVCQFYVNLKNGDKRSYIWHYQVKDKVVVVVREEVIGKRAADITGVRKIDLTKRTFFKNKPEYLPQGFSTFGPTLTFPNHFAQMNDQDVRALGGEVSPPIPTEPTPSDQKGFTLKGALEKAAEYKNK